VDREGAPERKYKYAYRNTFMGLVPKELRNVYFIGYTRPTTGGLNNITEMQCLFAHKMMTDTCFHREIYDNIAQRIRKYNKYYYLADRQSATDHLVHYGFYTDDIARLIRITPRLLDCRSLKDVAIYFIFPNCAFKFRQSGPYKVEGAKEMVRQIYRNHRGFSAIIHYLLTYALLQLTAYVTVLVAYRRQELPALAVPFLLLIVECTPWGGQVEHLRIG
jgi:Flavin-binding monooxygenase-like